MSDWGPTDRKGWMNRIERRLKRLESRRMELAGLYLAVIDPAWTTGAPKVTFANTPTMTTAGLQRVESYAPVAGQTVLIGRVNSQYIILGRVI